MLDLICVCIYLDNPRPAGSIPIPSAKWHLTAVLCPNTAVKCHLAGEGKRKPPPPESGDGGFLVQQ